MISKEKSLEITEYSLQNGDDATLVAFNIPLETLNRYKREYKKHYGDTAELLMALKQKFSASELEQLAKKDSCLPSWQTNSISFEGDEVVFGAICDTHIGSQYTDESLTYAAIQEFKKQGCSFMVHGGDVVEGMSGRDGHIYELSHVGYKAQRDAAVALLKEWDKPSYYISGNHDLWFMSKADMGADIVADICSQLPNATYLGPHEGEIDVNGVTIRLWHGQDGSSATHSYRVQQILSSLAPEDVPDILLTAHVHKNGYFYDRGCHAMMLGCLQDQSGYMRYKRLPAHVGFYVIRMKTNNGKLVSFSPTFYPIAGNTYE
jgi:predicted phosphodiesterase